MDPTVEGGARLIQVIGAGGFGAIIGWYLYFINRHRKGEVKLGDLVTVIAAIGGAAVTSLFDPKGDLFGAYGLGLFVGFFGYFLSLIAMVRRSPNFDVDWFLDGRRKPPAGDQIIPEDLSKAGGTGMNADPKTDRGPSV